MKIISLHIPWGAAIIYGIEGIFKEIETRTHARFECLIGQRIGIHNSKIWDKNAERVIRRYLPKGLRTDFFCEDWHPRGAIIGTVMPFGMRKLVRSCDLDRMPALPRDDERAAMCTIDLNTNGLLLKDPEPLDVPILIRGKQGIWNYEGLTYDGARVPGYVEE